VLRGTVYGADGSDLPFADVDFISFVTAQTYGKPAILAPGTDDFVRATERDEAVTVLYVNPANITALEATKTP
jgi:hypothetical protein